MIHSVPSAERAAARWSLAGRWLNRLGDAATEVLYEGLRLCGLEIGMPEARMSREWMEEYERSRKHHDDV